MILKKKDELSPLEELFADFSGDLSQLQVDEFSDTPLRGDEPIEWQG